VKEKREKGKGRTIGEVVPQSHGGVQKAAIHFSFSAMHRKRKRGEKRGDRPAEVSAA